MHRVLIVIVKPMWLLLLIQYKALLLSNHRLLFVLIIQLKQFPQLFFLNPFLLD